ncbi:hypothetical protein EI94DRAFT_1734876 [Lactarius quietus]|nr:hypothetical protein EI94DRAFT_1734876 [Lactarius quietus]
MPFPYFLFYVSVTFPLLELDHALPTNARTCFRARTAHHFSHVSWYSQFCSRPHPRFGPSLFSRFTNPLSTTS